ncbi:MAG: peptidase and DD-carboxypeptidase VanY/endolysin [Thermoleophilia bacterium]|nr:peptidase and DD-carboxypeptidase VanY/endolysin [Thermoleophilia bacterium]
MQRRRTPAERGSTSILALGILVGAAFLVAIVASLGGSYVAHAELQQAADLSVAVIERGGADSPQLRGERMARANGAVRVRIDTVEDGARLRIRVAAHAPRLFGVPAGLRVRAVAYADMPEPALVGDGGPNPPGVYAGPLEVVDGVARLCPRVARAYRAMDTAAGGDGITLWATSGFRGWAEQAALYAQLGPVIAAPPGTSRHHDATELDIAVGPAGSAVHRWLTTHGPTHGWVQRYSWEPWHWGYVAGC